MQKWCPTKIYSIESSNGNPLPNTKSLTEKKLRRTKTKLEPKPHSSEAGSRFEPISWANSHRNGAGKTHEQMLIVNLISNMQELQR